MLIQVRRRGLCLLALIGSCLYGGLAPSDARAKFTCEERGLAPERIALRGLPATPVAGRSYTLTVTLLDDRGPNPRPNLGAQYCGDAVESENAPGIDAWFRRVGGETSPVFSVDVRFPRPGPWALSFMDPDGYFYAFGRRHVRSPRPAAKKASVSAGSRGSGALTWLIAGGAFAIAAGGAATVRRRWRA